MSSLVLKEISASKAEDQKILELFESFREHVMQVSATHLLPDQIAVTTKNGFVELISTASGEFRLFLTYLDHIPLDASLRCFSLVPSLYAAATPHRHHHHLLYSLSYSNELLLADVETGLVRTLTTCASRPSAVACDGDYIVCGEGNGQVAVWRGSAEERERVYTRGAGSASLPPLLWRRALFEDAVVCAGVHRDQLVCCSADFGCVVVSVEDGQVRASLATEPDRVLAACALTRPSLSPGHAVVAVCQASRISVFSAAPQPGVELAAATTAAEVQPSTSSPAARQAARWSYRGACVLEGVEEVACASCLGSHLAVGTRSGLVLLCTCDAAAAAVTELVRFNVGYGVVGTQLFADDTLLVVTSASDVWRWPLCDLLSSTEQRAGEVGEAEAEEGEEEEPVPVSGNPPEPAAAPGLQGTAHWDKPQASGGGVPVTPHEVSYTQEGDAEDRNLSLQETSAVNAIAAREGGEAADGTTDSVANSALHGTSQDEDTTHDEVSSLHRPGDTSIALSDGPDDGDAYAVADESLGTLTQPSEPPTTHSLSASPPASASAREHTRGAVVADTPPLSKRSPPLLYDPESVSKGSDARARDAVVGGASAMMGSAEASHCDSTVGVSPPSSADTTAHVEPVVHDASGRRTTPSRAGGRARDGQGEASVSQVADAVHQQDRTSPVPVEGEAMPSTKSSQGRASPAAKGSAATPEALEMARLESEFDQAMARVLGPQVSVEGLRRGRRMDPRKVAGVLRNLASQEAETTSLAGAESIAPALAGLNSTKLLEEKRGSVGAAAFDFDAYRQAHRLEVDALQYRHPIKAPTYALEERVFDGVEAVARIQGGSGVDGGGVAGQSGTALPPAQDELRDVRHGCVKRFVDPAIAEERRRGGPDVARHRCDDLLFSSSCTTASAVLFHEDPLVPGTAWEEVLLLPLPLPPASSVF